MSFRDENENYRALRAEWCSMVNKAHHPGHGILVTEVETLMLVSYRLMRCIRNYLYGKSIGPESPPDVPPLPDALRNARSLIERKNGVVSLFLEANSLEALSRSAYRWLKANDRLTPLEARQ